MRRTFKRSPRTTSPVLQRGFRPGVNQLEGRTLLSIVTWINPDGGDWGHTVQLEHRRSCLAHPTTSSSASPTSRSRIPRPHPTRSTA